MSSQTTVTGSGSPTDGDRSGHPAATLVGRSIRHYSVQRELGQGGMGVVYVARDTLLERDVAVKVLPHELAGDPTRLARFRREAKLLAALNHPHIAVIHGLEEMEGGGQAIILELVNGETLSRRLARGRPAIAEALAICEQVAQGLEQAHERGVIHRDLKPGNAMLTADGHVKVLDFGLAWDATDTGSESLPTGGTPGYMSPEQIRGEPQDRRSDIFAFGCLLFECVAGAPAFGGASAAERLGSTLGGRPDWSRWPADAPASVKELVVHCLEGDRERRPGDLRGARDVLRAARGAAREAATRGDAAPAGLPWQATSFIGRDREIVEAERLLDGASLLTLTGPGGCGKTRLAQRVAQRVAASFPDGIAFVDLAPVPDPSRIPQEVVSALGLREQPGKSATDVLVERLRAARFLILLDNCEHVLDACADLATQLLRHCPGLRILATSREALGVTGEQAFPVPPLTLPRAEDDGAIERLRSNESVRLFTDRASLAQPGFAVTEANGKAVAAICRRLDGIPLGIELAAARVRMLSPTRILERLEVQPWFLAAAGRAAEGRHATLDATIRWSYEQLPERVRRTFRALSVFAGGWTLEAAESVVGDTAESFETLEDLSQLTDKSLVMVERPEEGDFRYRALEPIRQFAARELRVRGEEEDVRSRHLEHFLKEALEAETALEGPGQLQWLDRIDADRENVVTAANFGEMSPDRVQKALCLLGSLQRYWSRRGPVTLGWTALGRALAAPGAEADTICRAKALFAAGVSATMIDVAGRDEYFVECVALCRKLGATRLAARALNGLGVSALTDGEWSRAEGHLEQGLSLAREAGDIRCVAMALSNLAVLALHGKDYRRALTRLEEGVEAYRRLDDAGGQIGIVVGLSRVLLLLSDLPRVRSTLLQSVPLLRRLGDKRSAATDLLTTALLAVQLERFREGAVLMAAGEAVRISFGVHSGLYAPTDQEIVDPAVRRIREALGEAETARAWAEGRTMDFEGALSAAITFLEETGEI